jgi:hypothetical protein
LLVSLLLSRNLWQFLWQFRQSLWRQPFHTIPLEPVNSGGLKPECYEVYICPDSIQYLTSSHPGQ